MAGYARINLIQEKNDFLKNRLAKIGQANDGTLNTIKPEVKKQLQLKKPWVSTQHQQLEISPSNKKIQRILKPNRLP